MSHMVKSSGYRRLEREDPDEAAHRRARWLIARVLEEADGRRRRGSLSVRVCRLKIKAGRRLKRLRKSCQLGFAEVRLRLYKEVIEQLKVWKRLLRGHEALVSLPPLFG